MTALESKRCSKYVVRQFGRSPTLAQPGGRKTTLRLSSKVIGNLRQSFGINPLGRETEAVEVRSAEKAFRAFALVSGPVGAWCRR